MIRFTWNSEEGFFWLWTLAFLRGREKQTFDQANQKDFLRNNRRSITQQLIVESYFINNLIINKLSDSALFAFKSSKLFMNGHELMTLIKT